MSDAVTTRRSAKSEESFDLEALDWPGTGTLGADIPNDTFDGKAEREALTALAHAHRGDETALRMAVLDHLKALNALVRSRAEVLLVETMDGRMCARMLSDYHDALIELIYDFTVWHVYRATNPSDAERMAVVATGGYGRGLLAPGSDIDLLFLLPYKQTPWGESVVEYMLYMLWDLGLKVGHATRTTDQCVKLSRSDITIRTSMLDARLIFGDAPLFDEMREALQRQVIDGSGKEFIAAKLEEQDDRHKRAGSSRYRVEPNIKDGKGGLRDLHTLHWLARYLTGETVGERLIDEGIFSQREAQTFERCSGFLWTVRCHLHFHTGRAEEKLTFDLQPAIAERLNYADRGGLAYVERFMRHYFLVAKDVGDLTRVLCAALELQELKSAPGLRQRLLSPFGLGRASPRALGDGFEVRNGRITSASDDLFERDPVAMIRLFEIAEEHDLAFHPDVLRQVRASLHLITQDVRDNAEANALFLDLLCSRESPEAALRNMNEAGVLGRFIPEFGQIVSMMQFNMYHHFTVDEHLIQAVGVLSEVEHGAHEENLPLSTEIFPNIQNRRALFVAVFLHDIAKGRDEDHSIAGKKVALDLCPRLGLTDEETVLVAWLIEFHLEMSNTAQTRDINDPKTIQTFGDLVGTKERLDLLLLLTVADIRAVGPGVWNGWKGALLRGLYFATLEHLSAAEEAEAAGLTVDLDKVRQEIAAGAPELTREEIDIFVERNYDSYWVRTDLATQIKHATLTSKIAPGETALETSFETDDFTDVTEFTIVAPNHPKLLAMITGACTSAGADIVGASISTTRDGLVFDTLLLQRSFERREDEERRARGITEKIEQLLRGEVYLDQLSRKPSRREVDAAAFDVEPTVLIDNEASDDFTVLEIEALDRPGLLYDLTSCISSLKLEINSAFVTTFGEKAIDVFYVTDLFGAKITDDVTQQSVVVALSQVLRGADGS